MKIKYCGQVGGPFGWGVFGENITRELAKLCTLTSADDADVVFMPLATHDFDPASPARGKVNLALTFFESPLGPNAATNAAKYDVVFAGSTWCMERMRERGITNTALLIQGVDETIFRPQPKRKPDGQFRVFSGGKFEYRKGQDLVIAAFREFAKEVPGAHLVCSWFNPWPKIMANMAVTEEILFELRGKTQEEVIATLMWLNGIPKTQFTVLPKLPHVELAAEMANTDCGLFPNRCEGGTNLVLMEYAAMGLEVVANVLTGHADVTWAISTPIFADEDENHWAAQDVESITRALRAAYRVRDIPPPIMPSWPWSEPARIVMEHARRLTNS